MCGILGVALLDNSSHQALESFSSALGQLNRRGPDFQDFKRFGNITLGHARLSIIDTSTLANQPFTDPSGNYTIVFNGEIFNFKELRKSLQLEGTEFLSGSDTEVLLNLFIKEGVSCLNKLNGFFAFAIYDKANNKLTIARDRYGIKPLVYYLDDHVFAFSSEFKSLLSFPFPRKINPSALRHYFHLNYLPQICMLQNFFKLEPGSYIELVENTVSISRYYSIPNYQIHENIPTYNNAKETIYHLLEDSVRLRLVSDVPLGSFLSGGIDSSIITGLASKFVPNLHSFSIGYQDEPFFDETNYAKNLLNCLTLLNTVFSLSNNDFINNIYEMLDYLDEPFADSSALAVYILSKKTREYVTVALSGDGADELFSGYNKHMAEFKVRNLTWKEKTLSPLRHLIKFFPESRNNAVLNKVRQFNKFFNSVHLTNSERYWQWAGLLSESEVDKLLILNSSDSSEYEKFKQKFLQYLKTNNLNEVLLADLHLVLPYDMLTKVDLMSMANSLEVRTPFLDYRLVNFVTGLPESYKIDKNIKKKILQDTFKDLLPSELYNRPKHGFEVPLLKWFKNDLKGLILDDLLKDEFILEQGIFSLQEIQKIKSKLYSNNPGDVHATVWALIVFQYWWKKYLM